MTDACDVSRPEQTGHGCRIDNNACSCAFGCKSEFRYANLRECTDALKVSRIVRLSKASVHHTIQCSCCTTSCMAFVLLIAGPRERRLHCNETLPESRHLHSSVPITELSMPLWRHRLLGQPMPASMSTNWRKYRRLSIRVHRHLIVAIIPVERNDGNSASPSIKCRTKIIDNKI